MLSIRGKTELSGAEAKLARPPTGWRWESTLSSVTYTRAAVSRPCLGPDMGPYLQQHGTRGMELGSSASFSEGNGPRKSKGLSGSEVTVQAGMGTYAKANFSEKPLNAIGLACRGCAGGMAQSIFSFYFTQYASCWASGTVVRKGLRTQTPRFLAWS